MRDKRGAVDPVLLLSMLLCVALIIILIISIFNFAVHSAVRGEAEYIARDSGSLIEVAYAAPETLRASYKVPFGTDGYPKAGSFLLSKDNRVCVSPHSEDEMFGLISDATMAGFIGGVATKGVVKYRKQVWAGIKWVGRKIPGAKLTAAIGKAAVRSLAKGFGAIGGKIVKTKIFKKVGEKIVKTKIFKKFGEKLGKFSLKNMAEKGMLRISLAKLFGKDLTKRGVPRIAKALGASGSTVGALYYLENFVKCPPNAWPCGKLIAYAVIGVFWVLDFVWTTLPLIMMVQGGHDASNKETNNVKCYETIAPLKKAEPANCKTKIENIEFKKMLSGLPLLELMPGSVPLAPTCEFEKPAGASEQGGVESKSDFCYSCPNYFVSQPNAEITTLKLTLPGSEAIGEGINIYPSTAIIVGPKVICSKWLINGAWKAGACTVVYYSGLITFLYINPAWFINFVTGSNILPRDEYYYMAFPSRIDVEKTYNTEDGTSELIIVHAE